MNLADYKNIWVFAEYKNDEPLAVYYELLSKAKEIAAKQTGIKVCSVVLGYQNEKVVQKIALSGTDIVYVADHENLKEYNCDFYAETLHEIINSYKPESFLFGATSRGSELAPTVAAKAKTGIAAHCIDITINENNDLIGMVPAFGGKIVSEILIPNNRPQIASVRPGIISGEMIKSEQTAEIIKCDCSILDNMESGIQFLGFKPVEAKGQKLEDAEIIICVGRGISTDKAWEHIKALAKRLNAPLAYTRAFIDNGYVHDEEDVIGTSGKSIKPKICLTFGASGAMHFACGILKSKNIISINRDENAKIFDMSDEKVVADADKILEAMLQKLG